MARELPRSLPRLPRLSHSGSRLPPRLALNLIFLHKPLCRLTRRRRGVFGRTEITSSRASSRSTHWVNSCFARPIPSRRSPARPGQPASQPFGVNRTPITTTKTHHPPARVPDKPGSLVQVSPGLPTIQGPLPSFFSRESAGGFRILGTYSFQTRRPDSSTHFFWPGLICATIPRPLTKPRHLVRPGYLPGLSCCAPS